MQGIGAEGLMVGGISGYGAAGAGYLRGRGNGTW